MNTFHNLVFLVEVPTEFVDGVTPPPPKFLTFFDNTRVSEQALHVARANLPPKLHHKIRYLHVGMTQTYQEDTYKDLKDGVVWGLYVTTTFRFVSQCFDHNMYTIAYL